MPERAACSSDHNALTSCLAVPAAILTGMLTDLKRKLAKARGGVLPALEMVSIHWIGKLPVHKLRVLALRAWGASIAPGVTIYHGIEVRNARGLVIGRNSSIGNDSILDARAGLIIGSNVNLSTGVHIWTGQHDWASPDFAYVSAPVTIGDRAWLSDRTAVLPGVNIGEGAVLAAGAVASKDVGAYELAGGVPAKPIGRRPDDLSYELPPARKKLWWW